MNVIKTDIEGVLIIEPRLFRDARGYFFESFSEREFKEKVEPLVGYKVEFCQDNESMSSYGVGYGGKDCEEQGYDGCAVENFDVHE